MRIIMIAMTAVLGAKAMCAEDSERLEARMLEEINRIPYVDTHCHVPDPRRFAESIKDSRWDPVRLLGSSTYVAEFTAGSTWEEVKKGLALYGNHPYYRVILEAFRDLYGLKPDEELNDDNIKALSERMDRTCRREGWYDEVLRKRANLAHVIWLEGGKASDMPAPWFHPVWNIDAMIFVAGRNEKTKVWAIDTAREAVGRKVKDLAGMEKAIAASIDGFFAGGGVALKSTAAYFRTLDFDDTVPRSRADRLFARVVAHKKLNDADRKALEDYLMTQVLKGVAKNGKPIQFHTGNQQSWNTVAVSNPLGLNRLLVSGKWWDVKFVVLHGGYPYTREAITMTRYFGNCYLDLAWMVLFSPDAAANALAEALDIVPADRLTIGTDTANLEEMYGTIKFTRRVLARVLAEKVGNGYLTEGVAMGLARRVLYQNGMDLYGLK